MFEPASARLLSVHGPEAIKSEDTDERRNGRINHQENPLIVAVSGSSRVIRVIALNFLHEAERGAGAGEHGEETRRGGSNYPTAINAT